MVQHVPNVRAVTAVAAPLEHLSSDVEPPHVVDAELVEDATLRIRAVPEGEGEGEAPGAGFVAFLDGGQQSRTLAWAGVAPIVHGTVAAVVRERVARRLVTWGAPLVEQHIYAPLAYAPAGELAQAFPGAALVDTLDPGADGALPARHPALLLERARLAISRDRELLERRLAEEWCSVRHEPLLIDGSIGASDVVAHAACAVGVVKSHRTIYVGDRALETVLALRRGERSSVLRITTHGRNAVHSWYLRLRDPEGRDVLWGLVRVEVAATADDPGARADEVSRWVLAEAAPSSLPDARWDKMVYGIRSCEDLLKTITRAS